ncbi:MAG: class I SAM-dependent rRNA methyltransferase [Carnobacterium sp.]
MLKRRATERARKGYPILVLEDFVKEPKLAEGTMIQCIDEHKKFVAIAYLAKQNKGDGWILTTNQTEMINQNFYERLFKEAMDQRSIFKLNEQTTAYRVFNGEGDGLGGLTIDFYDGYYVFSWYSKGIYTHRDLILKAFQAVVTDSNGIYEKIRFETNAKPETDLIFGKSAPEPLVILENGIKYATYLDDGLMTGVFLDQRDVRQSLLEKYAMGKTVLNTFSYTGAFSVAAALGGAVETTSVDLAKRSLPKTVEQFVLNNLNIDDHVVRVMDVFDYFKYAIRHKLAFDVVVVDPPSFARSKKRTFSAAKDYASLLEEVIQLTKPKGIIVASTNAANVTTEKFKGFIEEAFKNQNKSYTIEETFTLPDDFKINPEFTQGDYLKVFIIRKK